MRIPLKDMLNRYDSTGSDSPVNSKEKKCSTGLTQDVTRIEISQQSEVSFLKKPSLMDEAICSEHYDTPLKGVLKNRYDQLS